MNLYDQLLEQMTKNACRPEMEYPFRQGNYAIATDGRMILAISADKVEETYPEQEKPNCLLFLQKEMNCSMAFTCERLKSLYGRVPMTAKEECDACDGTGRVDFEFEYGGCVNTLEGECPVCYGEGKVGTSLGRKIKNSDYKIRLSSHLFEISHVKTMIGLLVNLNQIEAVLCVFDKGTSTFIINNDVIFLVQSVMEEGVKNEFIIE